MPSTLASPPPDAVAAAAAPPARRSRPSRALSALALAAALGVVALFFRSVLLGGQAFFHGDAHALIQPTKELVGRELAAGRLPLWDPHALGGYPLLGSYVSGVLLPRNLLWLLLPSPLAFSLFTVSKHLLASLFQFLLLRRLGAPRPAAASAGILFALSGPLLSISDYHAFSFECFPLLLLVSWRALERAPSRLAGRRRLALAALAFAWTFLTGDLQTVWAAGGIALLLPVAIDGPAPRRLARGAVVVGAIALVAALAAGAQLLCSAQLLGETTRAELADPERLRWSLDAGMLGEIVWPAPLEAATRDRFIAFPFLGLSTGLLALWGTARALRHPGPRRRFALLLAALATGASLLALGANAPAIDAIARHLPGMTLFRYPQKWLGLLAFALSALAGLGLAALGRRRPRLALALAFLAVGEVFASASCFLEQRLVPASVYAERALPRLAAARPDLSPHDRILRLPTDGAMPGFDPRAAGAARPGSERGRLREQAVRWNLATLLGNSGSRSGARRVSGITSFRYRRSERLWREAVRRGAIGRLLDLWAARWVLTSPAALASAGARPAWRGALPRQGRLTTLDSGAGELALVERPTALPRALVVEEVRRVQSEAELLDRLFDPALDPRRVALVESGEKPGPAGRSRQRLEPLAPERTGARTSPRVTFLEDGATSVRLRVEGVGPDGAYLLLADRWAPGWRAKVDGVPRKVRRADGELRLVSLPPGRSEVIFRYAPSSVNLGLLASAFGLGVILLLTAPWKRRGAARS